MQDHQQHIRGGLTTDDLHGGAGDRPNPPPSLSRPSVSAGSTWKDGGRAAQHGYNSFGAATSFASQVRNARADDGDDEDLDADEDAGPSVRTSPVIGLSARWLGLLAVGMFLVAAALGIAAQAGSSGASGSVVAEQRAAAVAGRVSAVTSLAKIDAGLPLINELSTGRTTLEALGPVMAQNLPDGGGILVSIESAIWPEAIARRKALHEAAKGLTAALAAAQSALERMLSGQQSDSASASVAEAQRSIVATRRAAEAILAFGPAKREFETASTLALLSLILALVALFAVPVVLGRQAKRINADLANFSRMIEAERSATDKAIFDMMDAMLPLSHGDLRVTVPVTEHVTGSIADRINQVTQATHDTVVEVKQASVQTVSAMNRVGDLAKQIFTEARTATDETAKNRRAAEEGLSAVINARHRVSEARNLIQAVAKRAKHLGEGTMDLGSITDLIASFNERVKVLALNAQLIAHESQDRGGQFQVIARELRHLANGTSSALVEASASIRGMQAEAAQVISTVEDVTAQVVASTPHWDGAVSSLRRIESSADTMEQVTARMRDIAESTDRSAAAACLTIKQLADNTAKFITSERPN